MGRIGWNHLACNEPVEEHADAGEMLLDGRCRVITLQRLYVGRNVEWLELAQVCNPAFFAPAQKCTRSPAVGDAAVAIPDVDGEELQKPARGRSSRPLDELGQLKRSAHRTCLRSDFERRSCLLVHLSALYLYHLLNYT